MKSFHINLLSSLITIASGTWVAGTYAEKLSYGVSTWVLLLFVTVLALIVHHLLMKASAKRPQLFVAWFMGVLSGKLFLAATALLIAGLLESEHLTLTALSFFMAYAVYTVLEIRSLLPLLRNSSP